MYLCLYIYVFKFPIFTLKLIQLMIEADSYSFNNSINRLKLIILPAYFSHTPRWGEGEWNSSKMESISVALHKEEVVRGWK